MYSISLNGQWKAACVNEFDFVGQVPGSTINDLIVNGYLPKDLLFGDYAESVLQYENSDWEYRKKFNVNKKEKYATLIFERLDTYVDVYFNGVFLGYRENGNIEHKFDISDLVIVGENTVELKFKSCITAAEPVADDASYAFTKERLNIRRMQCTFGWDWVARFVCCSIGSASVLFESENDVIVDNIYVYTKSINNNVANIGCEIEFKRDYEGVILNFEILSPNNEIVYKKEQFCDFKKIRLNIGIVNPRLWYPFGYGEQPLYKIVIKDKEKIVYEENFGVRIVSVLQIKDEKNSESYKKCLAIKHPYYDRNTEFSSFTLVVNGIKVFCKGGNWVPSQPYFMPGKEEKIIETLRIAKDMGVNMIRVWGGGAFECKTFYDECSRLGILVTQDFLMACGQYPEKENWFINELLKESEYVIKLIRNQPCLMWWSGDNENAIEGSDVQNDYKGRDSFYKGIEPILMKYDPYREAFASSPYGGDFYASNTVGTTHNSQYLNRMFKYIVDNESLVDYKEVLKKNLARFVVEEPVFGAVSLTSLKKFMSEKDIFSEDMSMWLYHTKGNPGLTRELSSYFILYAEKVLGKFADVKDRFFKYKYIQYEWIRVIMEQARREKWFCSGIIFWMLNECWTAAAGWSLIDYYNKIKIGGYAFKRCAKPIILSIDNIDDKFNLTVINDGANGANCDVSILKISKTRIERIKELKINSSANENVIVPIDVLVNRDEILVADMHSELNDDRAFYKFGDLKIVPISNAITYQVDRINKTIILEAKAYVHVVDIDGDAVFSDNGFSMLAGETRKINYDNDCSEITIETYNLEIF
ncbi:MAG: hypothetical protein IJD54_01990 [Clostridia bacterium]|nr:hypothetical protein [Clostridia bacterium]